MEKRVELRVHFLVDDYSDATTPLICLERYVRDLQGFPGVCEGVVCGITINGKAYPDETREYL